MTPHLRYGLIGVAIGVPIIAYRMLSPEQRRRLRRARDRRQLGP